MSTPTSESRSLYRPVEAYPSLRAAAKIIGITAGALSRRRDVERIRAGREARIPAAEVVRLAGIYRRRSPSRVAAELVEHAIAVDPGLEVLVGHEVDAALEAVPVPQRAMSVAAFLETARQQLPEPLVVRIEAALRSESRGNSPVGWSPASR